MTTAPSNRIPENNFFYLKKYLFFDVVIDAIRNIPADSRLRLPQEKEKGKDEAREGKKEGL